MVFLEVNTGALSVLLAIALCSCRPASATSILDWIGFGSVSSDHVRDLTVKDGVPLLKVPFEEASPEEKFLQEAEKFLSLKQSELDKCQHKVVMKISSSCGSISDEDLAKLSVNLLNCQSAVEGRQQFPCTESMSLRDCTKNMDSDMWNTYHLMNNRARAVCYAARHQQFRALSEMTVNKLMTAAHEQLISMDSLKDGQSKLESLTSSAMDSVSKGHQALMAEQEKLRTSTQSVHDFVALNLRELTREKALIAAGQRELSLMTKEVKSKLDQASGQLTDQATERERNHLQVLSDLEALQRKTFDIWERVDSSTNQILAQHAEAAEDLDHMLENLAKINASIEYLLKTVEKTRSEIDERLGWIIKFIGESGDQVEWIQQCLGHGLYLVLGMVAASFVQAPFAVRCALLAIVPLNLLLSSYEGNEGALDFPGITILIFAFAAGHWLLTSMQQIVYPSQLHHVQYIQGNSTVHTQVAVPPMVCNGNNNSIGTPLEAGVSHHGSVQWVKKLLKQCHWGSLKLEAEKIFRQCQSWLSMTWRKLPSHSEQMNEDHTESRDLGGDSDDEGSIVQELRHRPQPSYSSSAFYRIASPLSRSDSPASSRSSRSFTPVRSGSPKIQCGAFTKTGQQCRNAAVSGSPMCRTHGLASPSRG